MAKVTKMSGGYEFANLNAVGKRLVNEFQRHHPCRRMVITQAKFEFSSRAGDRKTSKMNPPSSPSLLAVIRLLLQKVEGTSYPNNDPISIESLKAHLRCRVAELEVEEGLRPPPPETPERSPSLYRDDWWQPRSQRSRSISLESLNEDRSIQTSPTISAKLGKVAHSQR